MASYEKSKNGKWSVRFYAIENFKTVKKRLSGYKTKKEAEKAYLEYQTISDEEKNSKISKSASKLLFKDLFNEFLEFKQSRIKQSSFYDLESKSKLHILPFFENCIVSTISPKLILEWQNGLEKYSYKYKTGLRGYLSGMLTYAQKYYNIPNQLPNVDNFKNNNEEIKEMKIWSEETFLKFIETIDRLDYKAYFSCLYLTGCRKGELLATNWNDWDLDNNILNIQKSVTRKVKSHSWTITTPKNLYSIRKIYIPIKLSNLMKEYKEWQTENKESLKFVFGGSQPFADSNIERFFKQKCEEANVEKIRIHDFRHSHASYLISNGLSIVAVAKRLGHKDIEQTLNTYSHLLKSDEDLIIDRLNKIQLKI
ncbi:MAG: site-specific integrase [Clostridia bacterium]|nr:site-specific integrase [Clostridia bacterium]